MFNTAPTAPTGLSASSTLTAVTFIWNVASDAQTPAAGLSYNLRVGTIPGGNDVFCDMANPGSGLRRLPAVGNAQKRLSWTLNGLAPRTCCWSAQAIDTAYAGSARAPEQTYRGPVNADFDHDGDVDLEDFTTFTRCFNGPNRPPACD